LFNNKKELTKCKLPANQSTAADMALKSRHKSKTVRVKADIALHGNPVSDLRDVTCLMGSITPATRHKWTLPA